MKHFDFLCNTNKIIDNKGDFWCIILSKYIVIVIFIEFFTIIDVSKCNYIIYL